MVINWLKKLYGYIVKSGEKVMQFHVLMVIIVMELYGYNRVKHYLC